MQNVGAYGQEVAQTVTAVRALDRHSGETVALTPADLGFGYRTSVLRGGLPLRRLGRDLRARPRRALTADPVRRTGPRTGLRTRPTAPLADVRDAVLALRRGKGMVLDAADPDSVSAGSFFTNPILDAVAFARLRERAPEAPAYPEPDGRTKASAAWLIEHAGFTRGHGDGRVGLSRKHTLAIVNRGGATASRGARLRPRHRPRRARRLRRRSASRAGARRPRVVTAAFGRAASHALPFAAVTFHPHHESGSGSPMVLLHGFHRHVALLDARAADARRAPRDLRADAARTRRRESFDLGMSMTIPAMVDKLERQLDERGIERAHMVGSSLGGWLALELATRGRALSVVGLCPAGGWEPDARQLRATVRYFRRNELMLRYARPLLRTVASRPRSRRLALMEVIADPSTVTAAEALMMFEGSAECAIVQDALRLTAAGQMFGDLGHVDAPVRIAYGTRDRIVRWPNAYVRMRKLVPHAEYVALDGLGHLPMWKAPELVTRLILKPDRPDAGAGLSARFERDVVAGATAP